MKRKYWRRSSRWRAALARTDPTRLSYWRLQTLADNLNPLGGHALFYLFVHRDTQRMTRSIFTQVIKPSPWMRLIDPIHYFGRTEASRQKVRVATKGS